MRVEAPTGSLRRPTLLRYALGLIRRPTVARWPVLAHPFGVDDERIYSVVAHEMLDGGKAYADAIERKPPLLFWTYAAVFAVVGRYDWVGLHVVLIVWMLL